MIVMEKAFEVKTKIMSAARISELSALLPFKSGDLVLTESRLAPQLQLPDFVSVMVRDDLGRGPNTEELVEKAVHAAGANCSRVIGIGGGAVLDLAKLLSLEQVLPLHESFTQPQDLRRSRELVLIPTTPGTGSEVTPYSAVYFPDLGAQLILNSAALSADAALLCPEFLTDIPFKIFAASSFDAFTHVFAGTGAAGHKGSDLFLAAYRRRRSQRHGCGAGRSTAGRHHGRHQLCQCRLRGRARSGLSFMHTLEDQARRGQLLSL